MTKEDLLELKRKLSKLSDEESKQRDLYLRQLALGEIQGPSTGYPSIDKPQLQYYDFNQYLKKNDNETIFESLYRQNKNNLENVALEYFYTKITYAQFFENIKKIIKSFCRYDIKKDDYITICLAGIPEAMSLLYALGYIGAVGIFIPPYLDKETMISDIKKNESRNLIIMDTFYEKFKDKFDEVIEKTRIKNVIIVPTLNSSIFGKFKNNRKITNQKFRYFNDFINDGKKFELPTMVRYEENMPVAVVYSSGTTGILKGVLLSHDTFNNSASSYKSFGFNLKRNQKVYQAIPVWSSTGLIADGTTALYYGCTLHQDPRFEPIIYAKNLGKNHDNWGVATTELFNGLSIISKKKNFKIMKKLHILDYSNLENVYIGGTIATPNDKKKLNEILKQIGCNAIVNSSYGTCENGSIVTAELNNMKHIDWSVGIPIPKSVVMIIDSEGNELPYNTRGEITIKTECGMLNYYNRPDLNKIYFTTENGDIYKHTGDVGYILPNGMLIYEGRANDVSIIDDKNIYNFDIKKAVLIDSDIFDCEVFLNKNNKLCVNIIFYKNIDINLNEKLKSIQINLFNRFNDLSYVPELFKIRESFPMASSTKRDYKKIRNEVDGYIEISKDYLIKKYTKKIN